MKPWKRIEPTETTKVGWRTITSKTFVMQSGEQAIFDTVHKDGQEFAGIIALTKNNEVIIARQFRPGPEKIMDELPGGFVDAGETPEEAARRELTEETGYKAGHVQYLGTFHKDVYMNAVWHAFIAFDCIKVTEPAPEGDEEVEVTTITIDEFISRAMHDGMTNHAAVLMAYDVLMQRRTK
ncbi:MAG TPA: NUDIX hydrolase [Candidatus Saccharimonadales bacterium]|nr:NUDIX hydrolase [Candidatus Saccharimonadales bacterium]